MTQANPEVPAEQDPRGKLLELMEDVKLLLDYLQRLPDSRLPYHFLRDERARPFPNSDPIPPTSSLLYFLDRIAAIENAGPTAPADGFTIPKGPAAAVQGHTHQTTGGTNPANRNPSEDSIPSEEPASPTRGQPAQPVGAPGSVAANAPETWYGTKSDDPGPKLNDTAFLFWARDFLSAIAYPATVDSIRITRAFRVARARLGRRLSRKGAVETPGNSQPQTSKTSDTTFAHYGMKIAGRVRRYYYLAIAVIFLSIWASFMVFSGRVLIRENDALGAAFKELTQRINLADKDERRALVNGFDLAGFHESRHPAGYCDLSLPPFKPRVRQANVEHAAPSPNSLQQTALASHGREPAPSAQSDWDQVFDDREYLLPQQQQLCGEMKTLFKRTVELKEIHARWFWSNRLLTYVMVKLPSLRFTLPEFPEQGSTAFDKFIALDLATDRYAMEQMVDGLIGAILPVAYALLGALAAMFRRISRRAESETLSAVDFGQMRMSLILGVVTGSVIGLFSDVLRASDHSNVGIPLGTTALALLAGYASDRVFVMLDTLSERVFGQAPADRSPVERGKPSPLPQP